MTDKKTEFLATIFNAIADTQNTMDEVYDNMHLFYNTVKDLAPHLIDEKIYLDDYEEESTEMQTNAPLVLKLTFSCPYSPDASLKIYASKSKQCVHITTNYTNGTFHLGQMSLQLDNIVFSKENKPVPENHIGLANTIIANTYDDDVPMYRGVQALSIPPVRAMEVLTTLFGQFLVNYNIAPIARSTAQNDIRNTVRP